MENSFQTSFIPKKPIIGASVVSSKSSSINLFSVLAVIILFIAGIASGALFLYQNYLTKEKETLSSSLSKIQNYFDKDTINDLSTFDKRSSAANLVLKGHIVLSPLFKLIGDITIPQVQYTKFSHENTDKGFSVKMSGIALDYRSIALQADVFNGAKGRYFKDVVFSNITRDKNNFVLFDVSFNVDPTVLSFENNFPSANKTPTTIKDTNINTNNIDTPIKDKAIELENNNTKTPVTNINNKTQ
jgi:hypothetical protein